MHRRTFLQRTSLIALCAAGWVGGTPALGRAADFGDPQVTGLDANGHLYPVIPDGPADEFAFRQVDAGVQFRAAGVTKNVLFYGPETVRVNANLGANYWTAPSIVVLHAPQPPVFTVSDGPGTLTIISDRLHIEIEKASGALRFLRPDGRLYTQETPGRPETVELTQMMGGPTYEATNRFTLQPDEGIYGFGFTDDTDESNRRGNDLLLVQTNVGIIIPVMMSTRRYGIMWDTYSQMRFADGADGASLWAESAPGGVDYYFMGGDTPDEVIGAYRALTGDAPMYPKQAFGLFMSKERYPTQARLLEVAETFRKERFPLDYIVQDWQYWGSDTDGTWSGMIWNPERFPAPEKMTQALHAMHLKLMISIWPGVGNDTALARELDAEGLRFEPLHWISRKARVYDAFSPRGREIYFKHIKSGLLDKGVDALWMDGTEVEVSSAMWNAADNVRDIKGLGHNAMGDFARYLNPYTLLTTQGTYDGQRATSDKRVLTLTRSAWAGAQRTGAASWSGDIFASWKTLRQQVAGAVNVTVTGTPYFTQDTGGFFVSAFPGGEQNASWRELFARWLQFSAFNPLMRIHGTNVEREPYIFREMDPPVYASLLATTQLRYRLLPYIYALAWQVTSARYTMMRPLMMDFPDDPEIRSIDDAFMFGPALLVHPVTRAMYRVQPPPAVTIESAYLRTPDGKEGLAGQYFEGTNFETPKGRVVDLKIDHTWPDPPLAEIPAGLSSLNNFSARWEGVLVAPETGEYRLGLEGDDGFRLKLDGKTLVEDWSLGAARYRSERVTLQQGERVPIGIEYFQGGSDRMVRLAWRRPAELREISNNEVELDTRMETYLPEGSDWYDFWSGERFAGGQRVTREAPLDLVPIYVRAGSIVPMGPAMQYATEMPDAPYEIRIYPGQDARFTLYEDDNETYAYENGRYAAAELVWDDDARVLHLGARDGEGFAGMTEARQLEILVIGQDTAATPERVEYRGAARSINLS